MRIGPLRHRVTIQQKSTVQDAAGEESRAYSNIVTMPNVWANVRPLGGQERFVSGAEQQIAELTHRVEMRYRSDLTNELAILWEGRHLDIESIEDPSGKRQYLVLKCREFTP